MDLYGGAKQTERYWATKQNECKHAERLDNGTGALYMYISTGALPQLPGLARTRVP